MAQGLRPASVGILVIETALQQLATKSLGGVVMVLAVSLALAVVKLFP